VFPGAKFDEMPVFEGKQGHAEKSSALRILAVEEDWFTRLFLIAGGSRR